MSSTAYCRQIGLTVFPTLEAAPDDCDIAVMWHSLEHFEDPNNTIEILRGK